jgi:hypothetical protein
MAAVTGRIERIQSKTSGKGEEYQLIRINGKNYFDWQSHSAKAQVKEFDYPYCSIEDIREGVHGLSFYNNLVM